MKKVLVRGPVLTQSGYGEHTRLVLRSLRSREEELDLYLISTSWGATNWIFDDDEERAWLDSLIQKTGMLMQQKQMPQPDVSIQVTIPLEWEKLAPINIGVTAGIETTKLAGEWIEKCNLMDKIIVPSEFARYAFDNTSYDAQNQQTGEVIKGFKNETPIEVIPYPTKETEVDPDFSLDLTTDFNFLAVAQWGPRKNLENLIRWFIEENFDRENVGLILKTNKAKNCEIDREFCVRNLEPLLNHEDYKDRKCKVYLLHGYMTEEEMAALYRHEGVKAFITTTHGEGFGLPLFDAAQAGLPIIAPAWSGHTDFLTMPIDGKNKFIPQKVDYDMRPIQKEAVWDKVLVADSMWCYPKEGSFKMKMRSVMEHHNANKKKADKLAKWLQEEWPNEEGVFEQFLVSFDLVDVLTAELTAKANSVKIEDVPKISLITSVFDAEEHIEQLMEDVTRQSIFEKKCEWIILNANPKGKDVEEEVIKKYVEKYPNNIIYKRLKKDPGVYGVWNKAIKMSSGEFITNVNCDDRRAPWALETQARLLVSNADTDLIYNDSYVAMEANVMWEDAEDLNERYNFEQFSKEAMLRGNLPHNNPMWRKTLHDANGYFDEEYFSAGDWEFWLRCTFNNATFMKAPDLLGVYYFNPQGISTNKETDEKKRWEEKRVLMKYLKINSAA